jgi:hypothetical protein
MIFKPIDHKLSLKKIEGKKKIIFKKLEKKNFYYLIYFNSFFFYNLFFSPIYKFTIFSGLLTTNSTTSFSRIGLTLFARYYLEAGSLIKNFLFSFILFRYINYIK